MSETGREVVYSVVVPVYNSAGTLRELHGRLTTVMAGFGKPYEILLVDDGSRDDSWRVISELATADKQVRGFQLMRNFGQAAAVTAGLSQARGECLITIDDDLQNPPEEIPKLVAALKDNPELDAVIGVPIEKQHTAWRNIGSATVNWLNSRMFAKRSGFKLASFRVMRRQVVEPILALNIPSPAPGALLCMITPRIANVAVEHLPRATGRSGYTLAKIYNLTIHKFLGFSTFPLRLLATVGLIGLFASIALAIVFMTMFLVGRIKVPGWMTVVLLLVGISGFNFLAFGIVGEYLQQILLSVRQTPAYLIRTRTGQLTNRTGDKGE
jgi:dolichol-phosphate mannosyltransferase/undecaprenyl-phosphate 4-deoxy-4-formamido-L-arabinose transferase